MKKKTPEQLIAENEANQLQELAERINNGFIPRTPTRLFNVGDQVIYGNHEKTTISEVLFGGLAYKVFTENTPKENERKIQPYKCTQFVDWTAIFPLTSFGEKNKRQSFDDHIFVNYYNNNISSLLFKVYHFGVDFNPDYQRDLVWSEDQKQSLLDSIFSNVEIGKFTFVDKGYSSTDKLLYEIIDGKQRLSTLCEFYEDRLLWRGMKFSELNGRDAYHFRSFPIVQAEVKNLTKEQILRLFVKMNTCGTPMDKKHLEKIQQLIPKA